LLEGNPPDAKPAHLDQAGERRSRAHQQPAMGGFDMDGFEMGAVVGNEPREWQ
jgi:hypothetical protein